MEQGFVKRLRPGLVIRLSNLIIIQVLFVFTALAIVLFYPAGQEAVDANYVALQEKFSRISETIVSVVGDDIHFVDQEIRKEQIQRELSVVLAAADVAQSYIYVRDSSGRIRQLFAPVDTDGFGNGADGVADFSELVNSRIVGHQMGAPDGLLIPFPCCSRYLVYYFPFRFAENLPAVLASVSDKDVFVSNRGQMMYTLLILFLGATLVSLLIIYLLHDRFREPLKRLTKGFEKTTAGELYYILETDGDSELAKLSVAFNDMSRTLWEHHRRLKASNEQLMKANLMLNESREFLSTLVDSSPNCIVSASPDGKIMVFNRKAAELFGMDHDEAIGRDVDELFTHPLEEAKSAANDNAREGSLEVLCRRKDGTPFPSYVIYSPITAREGKVSACLYIIKDITESKSFQEMMIRLNRYSTRGQMAGDIAHEINNYLAILSGNIELMPLYLRKGDQEKIDRKLELMRSTVDRIARFADGLMDVNQGEAKFEKADINQLIETILAFLKPQNKFDGIDIGTDLSTAIPMVDLDISQIEQLVVNFLHNAADALADKKGDKKITTISELLHDSPTPTIRVSVRDNGPGVPDDRREHLFETRFTTKRKGHGIGLTTCRRIADAHNGAVGYRYDNGAVFHLEIPVERKEGASGAGSPPTSEVSAQRR